MFDFHRSRIHIAVKSNQITPLPPKNTTLFEFLILLQSNTHTKTLELRIYTQSLKMFKFGKKKTTKYLTSLVFLLSFMIWSASGVFFTPQESEWISQMKLTCQRHAYKLKSKVIASNLLVKWN